MKKGRRLVSVIVFCLVVMCVVSSGQFFNKGHNVTPLPAAVQPDNSLFQAILRRDAAGVRVLLKTGSDPNSRLGQPTGPTALMVAALAGNPSTYWDWYHYPGMVSRYGHWDDPAIAQILLAKGADVNAKDSQGWTPLLSAAVNGETHIAACLIEHGADVNARRPGGGTLLMDVARRNNPTLVRLFLKNGADINARDNSGMTALLAASEAYSDSYAQREAWPLGSVRIVRLLIDHGADVNAIWGNDNTNALMTSVYNRNMTVARLLLEHRADPNAKNQRGLSALMIVPSTLYPHEAATLPLLKLLKAHGADVNAVSRDGNTPLTWAADKGSDTVAGYLLSQGAKINTVNRAGHTALWFAVNNGDLPLCQLLKKHGALAGSTGALLPAWKAGIGNQNI